MFNKLKKQLTLFNSLLIGALLLLFVVVTFAGVTWAMYRGERSDIIAYAKEEAEENLAILMDKSYLRRDYSKLEPNENDVLFFYAFDKDGKLFHYSNPRPLLDRKAKQNIGQWSKKLGKPAFFIFREAHRTQAMFIVARPLESGNVIYGTIYVGKDVTAYYQILLRLLYVLGGFFVLFFTLVTLAGYIMAARAIEPIKRSYERQREFLADASHELRTPLSVLLTSVDAIQSDSVSQLTPFVQQVLADMKDEIKKMSRIIGDLLTLARSDAAVLHIVREWFELRPVAEQIVRTLQPIANEKQITLQLQAPAGGQIYADKERIAQLLLLLLDNALKYTSDHGHGEVQLSIRLSEPDRSKLEISVRDNGIGIAPEEQRLIFERFYRVDKARSRSMGGTGLGLPIAKWIVESHGGTIRVVSQPGQGATFIVTLPQPAMAEHSR